jgi:hypothetical protein
MMQARMLLLACVAVMATGAASAQERRYVVSVNPVARSQGYEKLSISKAAIGATPIRLWANAAIDPDCSPHVPGATLTILEPPAHGAATISDEPYYVAYPPANPRSACNTRKIPGHQAFYTAQAGFTGHDKLVLEGASGDGRVRRITVNIDVR